MATLVGQSLGHYHITEQLGEGGMATVYEALDTNLERKVAVKVIQESKQDNDRFQKRFKQEAKALARLTHSNIVPVIDFGEQDGVAYLVMPYLPGGTLKNLMGKPLPFQKAVSLILPIANALESAHRHDILHRDIKPSNILITEDGAPMLSDFGIAKLLDSNEELTSVGVGIGTPEYMAPEQVLGETIDGRADQYALATVLYELITGRKPFQADTPMAVVAKQASQPLPDPRVFVPNIPENIVHILMKAMEKKPENRYENMSAFSQSLSDVVTGIVGKIEIPPNAQHDLGSSTQVEQGYEASNDLVTIDEESNHSNGKKWVYKSKADEPVVKNVPETPPPLFAQGLAPIGDQKPVTKKFWISLVVFATSWILYGVITGFAVQGLVTGAVYYSLFVALMVVPNLLSGIGTGLSIRLLRSIKWSHVVGISFFFGANWVIGTLLPALFGYGMSSILFGILNGLLGCAGVVVVCAISLRVRLVQVLLLFIAWVGAFMLAESVLRTMVYSWSYSIPLEFIIPYSVLGVILGFGTLLILDKVQSK
jgi:serine/threonine protein kinase